MSSRTAPAQPEQIRPRLVDSRAPCDPLYDSSRRRRIAGREAIAAVESRAGPFKASQFLMLAIAFT
jgi:hypothetical protein